jgi:hypothetical protein
MASQGQSGHQSECKLCSSGDPVSGDIAVPEHRRVADEVEFMHAPIDTGGIFLIDVTIRIKPTVGLVAPFRGGFLAIL